MFCFLEYGGMVISVCDWLGGEERMGCFLKFDIGLSEDLEDEKEKEEKLVVFMGFFILFG